MHKHMYERVTGHESCIQKINTKMCNSRCVCKICENSKKITIEKPLIFGYCGDEYVYNLAEDCVKFQCDLFEDWISICMKG